MLLDNLFHLTFISTSASLCLMYLPLPLSLPLLLLFFYFICSDKKNAGILERAAKHKIASKYIPVGGRNREAYDEEVSSSLKKAGVQLVLMVSQSVSQSVRLSVSQLVSQLVSQSISQSISQSVSQSLTQSVRVFYTALLILLGV